MEVSTSPVNPYWWLKRVPGKQRTNRKYDFSSYTTNKFEKNREIEDDLWSHKFWKKLNYAENIETFLVREQLIQPK